MNPDPFGVLGWVLAWAKCAQANVLKMHLLSADVRPGRIFKFASRALYRVELPPALLCRANLAELLCCDDGIYTYCSLTIVGLAHDNHEEKLHSFCG
jgi:hypothetical protein